MLENINDLIFRFRYKRDGFDTWRILKTDKHGLALGDCDDFAITALYLESGRSLKRMWWNLLTLQAAIWMVQTVEGEYHAVLWVRGKGWIDNIVPLWREECGYKRLWPWPWPAIALKLLLGLVCR